MRTGKLREGTQAKTWKAHRKNRRMKQRKILVKEMEQQKGI